MSSNGTGSSQRSLQPSPTNSIHNPPLRKLDKDYDGDAAETLVNLHSYPQEPRGYPPSSHGGPTRSPPTSRLPAGSPHVPPKYPMAMGRPQTPVSKRPLSPGPDEMNKRAKMAMSQRRGPSPPPPSRQTPTHSQRPSPIPFRQQPTSHSPESRQVDPNSYPPSPPIPTNLPPHPRPTGLSGHATGPGMLPPLSTRSPPSAADRSSRSSGSVSPPRGKRDIVVPSGSPQGPKETPSPSSGHHSHLSHSSRGMR